MRKVEKISRERKRGYEVEREGGMEGVKEKGTR